MTLALVLFSSSATWGQQHPSQASVLETQITLDVDHQRLEQVLKLLSSDKIRFSYLNNDLPVDSNFSVHVRQVKLSAVLDELLLHTNLEYLVVASQIVLRKTEAPSIQPKVKETLPIADTVTTADSSGSKTVMVSSEFSSKRKKKGFSFFGRQREEDAVYVEHWKDTVIVVTDSLQINGKDTIEYKRRIIRHRKVYTRVHDLRYAFTVLTGLGSTFRQLGGDGKIVETRNGDEQQRYNFTLSAYLSYSAKHWLSLRVGIHYFTFGEQGRHTGTMPDPPYDKIDIAYRNSYRYLSIPLMAGLSFTNRKWDIKLYTGIAPAFFLGYKTSFPEHVGDNDPDFGEESPFLYQEDPRKRSYSSFLLTWPVQVEVSYLLSDCWYVTLSPSFLYSISSMYKTSDVVQSRPYYGAIALGVQYRW